MARPRRLHAAASSVGCCWSRSTRRATTRSRLLGESHCGHPPTSTPSRRAGSCSTARSRARAITLPSHATLLTGLEPYAHGVRDNGRFALPAAQETLAERLAAAGFETAAFVSAWVLAPGFGLAQGFSHYGAEVRPTSSHPLELGVSQRPAEEVTDAALAWLAERDVARPFFLWVHYYDPHLPRSEAALAADDPYGAEITHADAELGRLLAPLEPALDAGELLVVFTSDHGEAFGAHGEATHALLAYDSTLHVPLLFAGAGVPRPGRSEAFARHVDVVPTVLAALGLPPDAALPGRDLRRPIRPDPGAGGPIGWFESRSPSHGLGWAPLDGVRDARWKLTARPEPIELYDTLEDPGESDNVADQHAEIVARLAAEHAARLGAEEGPTRSALRGAVSDETRERLATLGYIEAAGVWEPGAEPDPRRWARAHALVDRARGAAQAGRYDEAIAGLEVMLHSDALRPLVLRTLAPLYRERGRFADAARAYREYVESTGAEEARWGLAETLLADGRADEVLEQLPAPASSDRGAALRARALVATNRYADADRELAAHFGERLDGLRLRALLILSAAPRDGDEARLRALLGRAPDHAELEAILGFHLAAWGGSERAAEAERRLRASWERAPERPDVLSHVGWGLWKLGRGADAEAALTAGLSADPGRHLDRARLGIVLAARGEPDRARALLEESVAARPAAPWTAAARAALEDLPPPGEPAG